MAAAILDATHPRTLKAALRLRDLAAAAGIGRRLTRSAIADLVAADLLTFELGNGRGNWSTFRPHLQRPVQIVKGGRA